MKDQYSHIISEKFGKQIGLQKYVTLIKSYVNSKMLNTTQPFDTHDLDLTSHALQPVVTIITLKLALTTCRVEFVMGDAVVVTA